MSCLSGKVTLSFSPLPPFSASEFFLDELTPTASIVLRKDAKNGDAKVASPQSVTIHHKIGLVCLFCYSLLHTKFTVICKYVHIYLLININ